MHMHTLTLTAQNEGHHKGGAASQARHLQMLIASKTGRPCFIDSDRQNTHETRSQDPKYKLPKTTGEIVPFLQKGTKFITNRNEQSKKIE
eukprot:1875614-Amphidinium_carterae.1